MPARRASGPRAVRVLVAVTEPLFSAGLKQLLEDAGMHVAGETFEAAHVPRLCRELQPEVLALESCVSATTAVELLRELTRDGLPPTLLLARSMAELDAAVVDLGIRGLVLKSAQPAQVLEAVRAVAEGEHWVGREHAARLLDQALQALSSRRRGTSDELEQLTPRERDIVSAIVPGASNQAIAARLQLSQHTVKHHLTSIFVKLKVSSRAELVAWIAGRERRGRGLQSAAAAGDGPDDVPRMSPSGGPNP